MTAMQTRRVLALGFVAIAVAAAGGVYAAQDSNTNQPPPPFMGRGPGGRGGPGGPGGPGGQGRMLGMLPMLGREIQLTDTQRDQIKAIADSHKDEWKGLFDRERTARTALDAAVTADAIDENAIRQKSAEVAAVDADLAVARAHAHAEVFQLLTADQKTKVKELRAALNARRQSPRGRH